VSGGAYGIDIAVHRGVLAAGGQAVVVLAGGLDRLYPRGNERVLAKARAEQLVLSEAKPGVSPTRWRFLERNRLIAAMSAATVVVEAARRSGALSTANAAAGLGRPLGAVPGPVTSMTSVGCHYLLRNREATCVTGAGDLVELISGLDATREAQDSLFGPVSDPLDLRVLDALPRRNGVDTAELAGRVGITPRQAQAALGRLSLTGEAVMTGGRWRRAFPAGGR
ncbi:MAG: DNA processing protein DprA, partial [Micrococcales bacterium]